MDKRKFHIVWVNSTSRQGKKHALKVYDENNFAFECNCEAYLFRNQKKRACKHMRDYNRAKLRKYV